jgi:LemA protein
MCAPSYLEPLAIKLPVISTSYIWWGLAALGLFWCVGAYNRLVRLRSNAVRSFAALAVPMQRYTDIVQSGPVNSPEPASAQAWAELLRAQAQFSTSLALARTSPLEAAAIKALEITESALQEAWLRVAIESTDVIGTPWFKDLQKQWSDARQQSHAASPGFAHTTHNYNTAVSQFPALLLAWLFGFRTATPLPHPL